MLEDLIRDVRILTADDLDLGVEARAEQDHTSSSPDAPAVLSDDPQIVEISRLAGIFGGVLLTGPPGTSKSYYAAAAAAVLTEGDQTRQRYVQFHASYQYEDFMIGFTPTETGFEFKDGPFLELVNLAADDPENTYVLVIDEFSRADVGRVFGEALTYVERTKRQLPFTIANGAEISVPSNLVILATMNPFDRGVDEVDAAFERRFAKVSMDPDPEILARFLGDAEMDEELQTRVVAWFRNVNNHAQSTPAAAVGHAYFAGVDDEAALHDLWNYQLKYLVERAFRRDENNRRAVTTGWERIFVEPLPAPSAGDVAEEPPTPG